MARDNQSKTYEHCILIDLPEQDRDGEPVWVVAAARDGTVRVRANGRPRLTPDQADLLAKKLSALAALARERKPSDE